MAIFRDIVKLTNELVTLGGAGRLEDAKREYEEASRRLRPLLAEANYSRKRINDAVSAIGSKLTQAKPHLDDAERLLKCRIDVLRGQDEIETTQTLYKVATFNTGMNSAMRIGVGSIAGGVTAVGAWSLVAMFGSASTGAAISGLAGVAATNATLAWFGGGALAAGGAGMAGGMTVLGGIVAIPLVYFAAKGTHNAAKKLEDAKARVEEAIVQVRGELVALPSIVEAVEVKQREVERLCNRIVTKVVEIKKVIQPHGRLSLAKQKMLAKLGKSPYTPAQFGAIAELTQALATFMAAFDAHSPGAAPRRLVARDK